MEIGAAGWAGQKARLIIARGDLDICWYCHDELTDDLRTIDHVVPRARGGTNALGNLVLACRWCNSSKGDRDATEFLLDLLRWRSAGNAHKPPSPKPFAPRQPARTVAPRLTQRIVVPPLVPWDHGHDAARERIAAVQRESATRTNRKGHPDP